MIQFSVYGRILNGNDALEKHMKRLVNSLPPEGSVRCLNVTEKQFSSMQMLVGLPLFQEKPLRQVKCCYSDSDFKAERPLRLN